VLVRKGGPIGLITLLVLGLTASCSSTTSHGTSPRAIVNPPNAPHLPDVGPRVYYDVEVTACSPNPNTASIIDVSGTITTNATPLHYLIVVALNEGQTRVGEATVIAYVPFAGLPANKKGQASWTAVGAISGGSGGVVTCSVVTGPAASQALLAP
jgi:hypothetical protein